MKLQKILAMLLIVAMMLSFVACDSGSGSSGGNHVNNNNNSNSGGGTLDISAPDVAPPTNGDVNVLEDSKLSYVLIYNPKIYDETVKYDNSSLSTGDFGTQVIVDDNRGDGIGGEEDEKYGSIAQSDWLNEIPWDIVNTDSNRGETIGFDYNVGDTKQFYASDGYSYDKLDYTCVYSGKYCHVWTAVSGKDSKFANYGKAYDEKVYESVVNLFDVNPRFVSKEGGKINILFHPMQGGLLGYFRPCDLFATGEITAAEIIQYNVNTDHAIININSNISKDEDVISTLAHEFQHLLCMSASFETSKIFTTNTWLNEGMSGYVEEYLFKGTKVSVGHFNAFNKSDRIRNGQSLYNFDTDMGYSYDIGVYGSVYLYSEYIVSLLGKDVFSKYYDYWTDSYSMTLSTAEALASTIPDSLKKSILNSVTYSSNVQFKNSDEELMSKLTYNFYLDSLAKENVNGFSNITPNTLVYDSINGAEIEGGGRIIVAVDGKFEIPEDAAKGLVYVGLDKDFKPVTVTVSK